MFKFPFIQHPRTGEPDTMLTLAVWSTLVALGKFALNGVSFTILEKTVNFGLVDAGLIAAILTPTLGAYVMRKHTDSQTSKGEENV